MGNEIISSLVTSLALTLVLELLFALICGIRRLRDILLVILVNVMTNPPVVLTHNLMRLNSPVFITIALEAAVVAIEGFAYKYSASSIKRPFLFSFGANVFSYLLGLLALHIYNGG